MIDNEGHVVFYREVPCREAGRVNIREREMCRLRGQCESHVRYATIEEPLLRSCYDVDLPSLVLNTTSASTDPLEP